MSISSSTRKAGPYSCNGSTVAFPFAFKVFTTADVRVVLTDTNAVESDLVLGTNYTVALNADQDANPGGTVTTTATYATGYKITLTSQVQNLQPVTLTNQGGFYPKVINDALDRLTIMAQQLAEQVGRAVKTSISSSSTPDQLLSDIGAAVTNASNSATAAAGSATNSANSATASANSATASAGSATAAANSATQAANSAASVGFTLADLQNQGKTAFTTAGASPAFTVTTNPAYGAYAANQRMRVKFHAAGTTGSNTLNRDGLGAKNLMRYNTNGVKVPAVVPLNQLVDIEYDGTDMVILDSLPTANVPTRQTVLSGPLDASGFPTFLPATSGSLSLTSQNITSGIPLVVTSANGFGTNGADDRIGSSTANLTWSGLAASVTNYLYVDIAADGSLTPGSTTLAPNYQFGGTRSTTNGQATFNIQEMWMTVGNGASAVVTRRVFVGEADTNASTVTATRAYAYQGRTIVSTSNASAPTSTNLNHNLGAVPWNVSARLECTTAEQGWAVGDELPVFPNGYDSASFRCLSVGLTGRNTLTVATANSTEWIVSKTASGTPGITDTNWRYKLYLSRGW